MPHFRDRSTMINALCAPLSAKRMAFMALLAVQSVVVAAAETPPGFDYPSNLREVYGAYQAVLARRDTCISAFPQSRAGAEKAYVAWHDRHRKLIEELDQRVTMMIRGASNDDKEYARNVGKYEGAILRQREEVKKELLQQLPSDLEAMCKALPEFLRSADSDLEKAYAEELAIIRKRPLAGR
jgi:hypothetical protein